MLRHFSIDSRQPTLNTLGFNSKILFKPRLTALAKGIDESIADHQIHDLFNKIDLNHNNQIELEEFKRWVNHQNVLT